MSEGDLDRIVRASELRYFAPGEAILAPAADRPAHCYVIRQGTVRGERPGADAASGLWELSAGEMFPLGALLARRGVTSIYRATQDTFCLAFPAAAFDALIGSSAIFQDFCTRRLAHLLDLSRAQLQATYAATLTEQRGLATPLHALLRQAPITCPSGGIDWRCAHDHGRTSDRLDAGRRRGSAPARHLHAAGRDWPRRAAAAAARGADCRGHERAGDHALARRHRGRRGTGHGAPRHPPRRGAGRHGQGRRRRVRARSVQPAAAVGARACVGDPPRRRHSDTRPVRGGHPRAVARTGRARGRRRTPHADDLEPQRPAHGTHPRPRRRRLRPCRRRDLLAGDGIGGPQRADDRDRPGQRPDLRQPGAGRAHPTRSASGCCRLRARSTKRSRTAGTRCAKAA